MTTFDSLVEHRPLVAILRGIAPDRAVELAHAAWDTGMAVVEVPIQTPDALPTLAAVCTAGAERGEDTGAGTVVSIEQVEAAARAGARFTVAPGLDLSVWRASEARGLPHLPGVGSATEVQQAVRAGGVWIKVFPASALGPGWIAQVRAPFPQARFVATGGVDARNAASFLDAGAAALGVGGSITKGDGLAALVEVLRARPFLGAQAAPRA